MKPYTSTAFFVTALLSATAGFAQQKMDDMKGMDAPMKAASGSQMTHQATGVVKKVDAKAGIVTLAHEPVPSMKWPAMKMGFQVQDTKLLDKLAVGQKVNFDFIQGPKGYVVTAVK